MATPPLFRHGGAAFTVEGVRAMVKAMMASIGLDPARFGAHSLRIGGATAALAAGLSRAARLSGGDRPEGGGAVSARPSGGR